MAGAKNLQTITIPASVTAINGHAFYNCTSITKVICNATSVPAKGFEMFEGIDKDQFMIYVPASAVNDYKENWSDYADYIVAQNNPKFCVEELRREDLLIRNQTQKISHKAESGIERCRTLLLYGNRLSAVEFCLYNSKINFQSAY